MRKKRIDHLSSFSVVSENIHNYWEPIKVLLSFSSKKIPCEFHFDISIGNLLHHDYPSTVWHAQNCLKKCCLYNYS